MSMLLKLLYTVVAAAGTIYIASAVFQFLGIGIETYGIYMMFMVAIALLYIFLPENVGSIFSKSSKLTDIPTAKESSDT